VASDAFAKCGKEEIVGLLTALKLFLADNSDERHGRWLAICEEMAAGLSGVQGATVALVDKKDARWPVVELAVHDGLGFSAGDLLKRLQDGEPSVHANHARIRDGIVVFGPTCMKPGEAAIVIERVRANLPHTADHRGAEAT
jgi:D-glucosaminate-6-phosphate ammonia-lyase